MPWSRGSPAERSCSLAGTRATFLDSVLLEGEPFDCPLTVESADIVGPMKREQDFGLRDAAR